MLNNFNCFVNFYSIYLKYSSFFIKYQVKLLLHLINEKINILK